jgi:hypothetical protein
MPHYKRMYDDKEHLYAFDLDGRDVMLQIEKVFPGEVAGEKGRTSKKPIVKFVGKDKKLAVNKTNGKTIAQLYGTDTDNWVGQGITLYPTTTNFGGETVECIRIRPVKPERKQATGNGKQPQRGPQQAAKPQNAGEPPPLSPEEQAEIERIEREERG